MALRCQNAVTELETVDTTSEEKLIVSPRYWHVVDLFIREIIFKGKEERKQQVEI